jgi:hypothetical protein
MKRFGIRITLPEGDPMRKSHLLGEDWESFHWYETKEQREEAMREMAQPHIHYRLGDTASVVLDRVER